MDSNILTQQRARIIGLAWGMHAAFRQYIQRISDGEMLVYDQASMLDSGEAFFPAVDENTETGVLRFAGTLHFSGHRGMLVVKIEAPWLQQGDDTTVLTVADPFESGGRMPCVTVDLQTDGTRPTWLTEEGADLFMGNYLPHVAFDPVRIVWEGKN